MHWVFQGEELNVSYRKYSDFFIGSLYCLWSVWLARAVTVVLVLRHSIGNRSTLQVLLIKSIYVSDFFRNSVELQTILAGVVFLTIW